MVSSYSYRADGSTQLIHLAGCSMVSGGALVCTCAAVEREQANRAWEDRSLVRMSTMCGGCGSNTMIAADGRHFIAHPGRDGQPCPGDHEFPVEPNPADRLATVIRDLGVVLSELALVMKLHRWLTSADQVVGMTVPVPVVHRLAEPVRGLLVQVDLRRGRPPYVVLRDDHGAEIPVQPETVRKFLPPIPVPEDEAALTVSLPEIVETARRVLKTPGVNG